MRNIINHRVNLPSRLIQENWDKYSAEYVSFENSILSKPQRAQNLNHLNHTTGAYQIPRKTFYNILDKSKLAKFFKSNEGRFVETKQKVILRGSLYYPGMIKLLNVQEHCQNLFSEISALIGQLIEMDRNENIILFLGTIDCLKNYLLILLNALDHIDKSQNLVDLLNRNDYENLLYTIEILEYFQFRTITNNQIEWSPDPIKILNIHTYQNVLDKIILRPKFDSENIIRKFRECNNPQKLVSFAESIANEYLSQDTLIVSFSYGGIELPFVVNAARMIKGKTTLPFIVCSLSNYSVRNIQNITDLNDSLPSYHSENFFRQFHKILILDDSVTTGKTIQTFIDLYPITLKEIFLGVVSFKNSNRYHHLIRPFHGGINPVVLDSAQIIFINNYTKTYKKFCYTNRSGVFDKEKQKVSSLLKKSYKLT